MCVLWLNWLESAFGEWKHSRPCRDAGLSHSDDELWHNFFGQETYTQLPLSTQGINEYLVFDWGGKGLRLRQSPSATGVGVGLRVLTPQLASQSVLLRAPGQAPGDCLA